MESFVYQSTNVGMSLSSYYSLAVGTYTISLEAYSRGTGNVTGSLAVIGGKR